MTSSVVERYYEYCRNSGVVSSASKFNDGGDAISRCADLVSSFLSLGQGIWRSPSIDRGQYIVSMTSGGVRFARNAFDAVNLCTGAFLFNEPTDEENRGEKKATRASFMTVLTRLTLVAGRALSSVLFLEDPSTCNAFKTGKHSLRLNIACRSIWLGATGLCLAGELDSVRKDPFHKTTTLTAKIVGVTRSVFDCLSMLFSFGCQLVKTPGMFIASSVVDILTSAIWVITLIRPPAEPKNSQTKEIVP